MGTGSTSGRLVSLDAFRGLTIAGMILVNNPGDWNTVYPPLLHAEWHGWTPTDLIFPFFLFIVGVSMAFSFGKRLEAGGRSALYRQVIRRSLIIFALGLLLNLFPSFDLWNLRVAGVLQRIAVVYFVVSLIVMHTSMRAQVWISGGVLCFYWAFLTLIPVPGVGAGVLTPEGNLAAFVDSYLLPGRMWQGTWDPEGLLSTIPAVVTTLLGVLTGRWLRSGREKCEIAGWMFVAGWGAILVGVFWGILFPINKNLWTSSYVVFTAGAALQFLAVCYWLIDIKGYTRWFYPAIVYGMNAIAVYVLSGMVGDLLFVIPVPSEGGTTSLRVWILEHAFASWATPMAASLAFAVIYVIVWFFLMDILYRKRIFIKV